MSNTGNSLSKRAGIHGTGLHSKRIINREGLIPTTKHTRKTLKMTQIGSSITTAAMPAKELGTAL